ncbi:MULTISPECIES: hypothetical protein [unclassified Sulfurimonas]|uniref:hypothetical protein n=1 Tax=unclassified Sulfurimonas TaxID=2623549 RepID=UPI0025D7F7C6|nr:MULTISPECIES: hypothetical protein [unclassified Sulfurimonas]
MNNFKLKLMLAILTGIVFSFLFIILAFIVPATNSEPTYLKKPTNLLEKVSKSIKE